jgi:hypothetical protein
MTRKIEAIAVFALVSVVAFKLMVGPGKMVSETVSTPGQKTFFGLHIAQPSSMKDFPAELPLP